MLFKWRLMSFTWRKRGISMHFDAFESARGLLALSLKSPSSGRKPLYASEWLAATVLPGGADGVCASWLLGSLST